MRVYGSGGQDVNHLDELYDGEAPDILDNAYVIVDYAERVPSPPGPVHVRGVEPQRAGAGGDGRGGKLECFIPEGTIRIGTRKFKDFEEIEVGPDERVRYQGFHHGASYLEHLDFLDAIRSWQAAPS